MDRRRLADVRAGTADEQRSGGSGYVVGQRLVLTCRHVVADDRGTAWPRLEVWLGHPGDGPRRRVTAQVAWTHPDPDRDAALLRIEGEPFTGASPVRWGRFVGSSPVPYTGLGFPEFADYESGRGAEQLHGTLPPLGVGAHGGFVLDQASAPEVIAGRAWRGVSGAAVFCQGLLTAVVIRDDGVFGNRRLHAVPVSALATEPGFARLITEETGITPALEGVELAGFLQSPVSSVLARTPGSLLAAAVEAVEFTGRGQELAQLAVWRDSGEGLSVMLVTGEGGQGKTRLARQFAAQVRNDGWAAGFLAARTSGLMRRDGRDQLPSTIELARRVREATSPILLVADYAETRPDEITALTDIVAGGTPAHPVRVLLLSRTAGDWWANLTEALGQRLAHRIRLEPLTKAGEARRYAYAAAVTSLARRLAAFPEPPAERVPDQPWDVLAYYLAANPPGLDDPRLGNALALQITALTSLLSTAAGWELSGDLGEHELIRHERGYLRRAAAKRRLFDPGILSDRSDDDERAAEAWVALERSLAGVIILGPSDNGQACAIGALASEARAGDVVNWLAALYPPPGELLGVGTVQPDRLGELLLGPVLIRQPGLLGEIGSLTEAVDDAHAALFALMRTAAHTRFSQVGEQAAELISRRPAPFAIAAPVLMATLAKGGPLREGLIRLGREDPAVFRHNAYMAINQLPEISVSGALFSAALTTQITGVLRSLAEAKPDAYLPDLAAALNNLGLRLAQAGQQQAALAPAQEAADTYRRLAADNPDAYLPDLAAALNNLGLRLAQAGQQQAALATAHEAVTIRRQLASRTTSWSSSERRHRPGKPWRRWASTRNATSPDAHLPDLAMALNNLSIRLAQAGQQQAALAPAQEAADAYRQLAAANPDAHLPGLATSLNNLGNRLAQAGQQQAALAPAQEAADAYRQLAAANPDAHLPDLAMALNNLSIRLAQAGQQQAALAPAQEAADAYRQLAAANPDAHLPGLATSLNNLGNRLAQAGLQQAALAPAQEAADAYRQLAAANPDAHLPDLAMALNNLSIRLAQAGQQQAALAPAQEAADAYRQLAAANPDAHLPSLATSLNNLGNRLAQAGQQQAALAPAQEAADAYRQLAAANPDAHLPDLAMALNNLSIRLAQAGQQQAALAPAQEAADAYRQLAAANPDAHLPALGRLLNDLGTRLGEVGKGVEVRKIWESAFVGLPNESSQLALSVAYAAYLLGQPDHDAGMETLVNVLMTPGLPGPVKAGARQLLAQVLTGASQGRRSSVALSEHTLATLLDPPESES